MKNKKLAQFSFLHSLLAVIYIGLVAILMLNLENWVGQQNINQPWGVMGFLLLFVISATVVGGLVLGRPIIMYLDNQKKSALELLLYTVVWLFIWMVLIFVLIAWL